MAEPQRCDVAVWDIDGTLTAVARAMLRHGRTYQGPQVIVDSGEWCGRRIAIGRPRRVTAARLPMLTEGVRALALAHPPRLLVCLGPAAVATGRGGLGEGLIADAVRWDGEILRLPTTEFELGLPRGLLSSEPIVAGSEEAMTAEWASAAASAAIDRDAPTLLLAVAIEEAAAPRPPSSRPRTRAREAGSFVGRLLAGKWPLSEERSYAQHAGLALERIVNAI